MMTIENNASRRPGPTASAKTRWIIRKVMRSTVVVAAMLPLSAHITPALAYWDGGPQPYHAYYSNNPNAGRPNDPSACRAVYCRTTFTNNH